MSPRRPVTSSADITKTMPDTVASRLDRIEAAISSLQDEERRVGRLGLDGALSRCREQRRYWEFLRTLFTLESNPRRMKVARGVWE